MAATQAKSAKKNKAEQSASKAVARVDEGVVHRSKKDKKDKKGKKNKGAKKAPKYTIDSDKYEL